MANRAGADTPFGAHERQDTAERLRRWIVVERRQTLHQLRYAERHDQIFRDAALQQLPVQQHVVDMPDDNDLGAGVTDRGEPVDVHQHRVTLTQRLDNDQVWRRRVSVIMRGGFKSAHLHTHMCLCQAPVLACLLKKIDRVLVFAESLDVDTRQRFGIYVSGSNGFMRRSVSRWSRRWHPVLIW